jgi:hypothetical protein
MDRKESIQLSASRMEAMPVISSMMVMAPYLAILIEVSTSRQKPSRLEEVFRMWEDLFPAILVQ